MFYVKWLLFFEISKEKVQVYNCESILDNETLQTARLQVSHLQAAVIDKYMIRNKLEGNALLWNPRDYFILKSKVLSSVSFQFETAKWIYKGKWIALGDIFRQIV